MLSYIFAVVVGLLIIAGDQLTKYIVYTTMYLNQQIDFIPGFMSFWYIHNKGGAWGFLDGNTWILVSVTVLAMLVFFALILKYGAKNKYLFWCCILIMSGGIGNLIDRLFRDGNVIDFLNFQFIDFPVFNIADCGVVVGVVMLAIYFIYDLFADKKVAQMNFDETDDK